MLINIKSGIYCILNKINNKKYIGSAIDLKNRKYQHFKALSTNRHHNKHLQRSYNKYGENSFVFQIIEFVPESKNLISKEQFWINMVLFNNKRCHLYNECLVAGSQLGRKQSEKIKQQIRTSQKAYYKNNPNVGTFRKKGIGHPGFGMFGTIQINGNIYPLCKRGHPRMPKNVSKNNHCKLCYRENYKKYRG